jgi:hypothetical protein
MKFAQTTCTYSDDLVSYFLPERREGSKVIGVKAGRYE